MTEIVLTADQPGKAEVRVTWEAELTLWENALSLRTEQEWGGGVAAARPKGHTCLSETQNTAQKSRADVEPLAMPWRGGSMVFAAKQFPEKTRFRMPGADAWSEGSCGETPSLPAEPEPNAPEPTPEPEEPDTDKPAESPDETPEEPKDPETPKTPETPDLPQESETPAAPEPSAPPAEKAYRLEEGVLSIEQAEPLADWNTAEQTPWYAERAEITAVQLCAGIARIGDHAFAGCKNLRVVRILTPELTIGTGAFAGCEALETVYYPGTKAQWRELAIGAGNDALQGVAIHCGNGQIKPG